MSQKDDVLDSRIVSNNQIVYFYTAYIQCKYIYWVFSKGFWWRVTRGAFKLISNVSAIVLTIVQKFPQLFQQLFKCFCNCFNNCSNVSTNVSTIVQMFLQLFQQLFKCFCNCFNNCSNVAAILSIICSKVSGIVWLFQQRFRQNQQFSIMVSKSTQIFVTWFHLQISSVGL